MKRYLFALLFLLMIIGCTKSLSLRDIEGKWNVKTIAGTDVALHKMTLNFKNNGTLLAFDGCNGGDTPYKLSKPDKIDAGYPGFTYMYCNEYQGRFGTAIQDATKFRVVGSELSLYNSKGDLIITAERK